jgi:hypothetical protein
MTPKDGNIKIYLHYYQHKQQEKEKGQTERCQEQA